MQRGLRLLWAAAKLPALQAAVTCWGENNFGQLDVPQDLGAVQISAGYFHACAVTSAHSVRCWGSDEDGESSPPGDLGPVLEVGTGWDHSCARTLAKRVRCWGSNEDGQSSPPGDLEASAQVALGVAHACSRGESGLLRCWGRDASGQAEVPGGLGPCLDMVLGLGHSCALRVDGQVRCWGDNDYQQLEVPRGMPAVEQLAAGRLHTCARTAGHPSVFCWGRQDEGQGSPPAHLGSVTQVAAGGWHTCAVSAAGLRCWGEEPGAVVPSNLSHVVRVEAGWDFSCAMTASSTGMALGIFNVEAELVALMAGWGRDSAGIDKLESQAHATMAICAIGAIGAVALACRHLDESPSCAAFVRMEQDRRIDKLEKQVADMDARSQEEEARVNGLQGRLAERDQELAMLLRNRATIGCRLIEMDEELNARTSSLQGLLRERDQDLVRLSRRGEVEEARVTRWEQLLSNREEELARLSSRGDEDRARIGSLELLCQGLAAKLAVLEKGLGEEALAARGIFTRAQGSGDEVAPSEERQGRRSMSQVEVERLLRGLEEKQDQRIARLEAEREGKQGFAFDMQAFMHASLQQQMLGLQAHVTQLFQDQGRRQPSNGQPSGEQPDVPAAAARAPTESAETPEDRRMESQLMQLASVEIERLSKKLRRRTQQLSQLTQASGARPRSAAQALDSSSCNSRGSSVGSFAMTYSHEQGSPFADVRAGPGSAATEDFSMVEDTQTRVTVLSEEASVLQSCLVLTFNKYPKKLTEALLASEMAQRLRAEGLDLEPAWANGAKIFVKGLTQEIMEQSAYAPERLRNCDVVLQEADEEAVLASLSVLQYRVRPRLKCRTALSSSCPTAEGAPEGSAEEEERADAEEGKSSACQPGPELVVERTFVDFRLPKVLTPRSLYTLSSNDKDGRFPNPRKWAPAPRAP